MSDVVPIPVATGYDAVYEAWPQALRRIWRQQILGAGYPDGFEHISFVNYDAWRQLAAALQLPRGAALADLARGAGGPGLSGASRRRTCAGPSPDVRCRPQPHSSDGSPRAG